MFDIQEFNVTHESESFTCLLIKIPSIRKYIATIRNKKAFQYIVFQDGETDSENMYKWTYNRYNVPYLQDILYSFVAKQVDSLGPFRKGSIPLDISLLRKRTSDHIFMNTYHHKYKITITEQVYHYYIEIGGLETTCMELFVYKEGGGHISQIYSEPECSLDAFWEVGGEAVDMIKGSLQVCQMLFDVSSFTFRDNSEIECAQKIMTKPVGKRIVKPMSLAHLSIVNKCMTWYEHYFNASLNDAGKQTNYLNALELLNNPIGMTFSAFVKKYRISLNDDEIKELEAHFGETKTWIQFLRSIPKKQQCSLLTWVPEFLDKIMDFQVRTYEWIIHLDTNKQQPIYVTEPYGTSKGDGTICCIERSNKTIKRTFVIPFGFPIQKGGTRKMKMEMEMEMEKTRQTHRSEFLFRHKRYA